MQVLTDMEHTGCRWDADTWRPGFSSNVSRHAVDVTELLESSCTGWCRTRRAALYGKVWNTPTAKTS